MGVENEVFQGGRMIMVTKKTATSKVTPAAEVKETAAAKETVTVKTAAASKPETKKV